MEPDEKTVLRDGAQINGRTEAPRGSDNSEPDARAKDNLNTDVQENSANGLDSEAVRGGQDGRNNRGMGSQDMDSKNGVLRMGDQDNSTMEVTDAAISNAAASEGKTNTSTVSVTTAGPDDYASDAEVKTPNAQEEAKKSAESTSVDENKEGDSTQDKEDRDIAETGTSLDNQPTY
ncbi:hypothetical protein J2I47_20405 [Fibrella sp. HMF5335]|uniref:Uncharacterized protein n=1 Tax=Fibrella rubiginis TaxID=2817060 RepID=A0A939GIH9_9BACT|nr:hypothetical protein [Fibrella rubiginis]MBO0938926.1 hypothetical protein [Fibrella rubiginis]